MTDITFMRQHQISSIFFLIFLILLVLLLNPQKNISKEYSDFAIPEELVEKYQILSMPWQKLNGPFGGQGYTIRFFPNNSNNLIVTDSFAGIHISNDKGNTWEESVQGIDSHSGGSGDDTPVFVTTIDPNNNNRVWCGVRGTMGVFLSEDGGQNWKRKDSGLPDGDNVEIRGLAVKPGDSNTIFAAGDLEEIAPLMGGFQRTQGILYRTADGGENWTKILDGGNLFKDIIIDPNNPSTVYVASGFFDRHQLTKLEGIYKSTDGGNTWTQINSGIRNLYVTNIKFDPKDSNTIWGTTGMLRQSFNDITTEDGGIIVTHDGGMSWIETKRGRNNGSQQIYSALGISPTNPNVIYAGAFGIFFKSKDGGRTWSETGSGPLGANAGHPIDIAVDPNDENTIYLDSYIGGVFKSTDGGNTWITDAFGYSGAETKAVAVSADGKKVFASGRSGIFSSEDKGVNWTPIGLGDVSLDELEAIAPHPTDLNKILLGDSQNAQSSIFLSTDGGMVWKTVFMLNGVTDSQARDLTGAVAFTDIKWSKSNPDVAFASSVKQSLYHDSEDSTGWGVFKSTDGGMTWANKQNGIPGFKNTWSLDIDPTDEKIIYAATNDSGIIKSIDGGETWTQINNGLGTIEPFRSISVCPANTQVVLAGNEGGQIFRTADGGKNWQIVSSDLKPGSIVSIIFNPISSTHQVYAGEDATGFYISNDDGQTWQQFNNGLLIRAIMRLGITPDGSAVYAATNGGGVFRLPITGDVLTLTRKQVETPSSAGIDAINNKNTGSFVPLSSSGSAQDITFSLSVTGSGLDGIKLFQDMISKTSLNIGFDQAVTMIDLSKIEITSALPAKALKIKPSQFLLTAQDSSKKVKILVQSLDKLGKIKEVTDLFGEQVPDSVTITVTQTTHGMVSSKDFEIPVNIEVGN